MSRNNNNVEVAPKWQQAADVATQVFDLIKWETGKGAGSQGRIDQIKNDIQQKVLTLKSLEEQSYVWQNTFYILCHADEGNLRSEVKEMNFQVARAIFPLVFRSILGEREVLVERAEEETKGGSTAIQAIKDNISRNLRERKDFSRWEGPKGGNFNVISSTFRNYNKIFENKDIRTAFAGFSTKEVLSILSTTENETRYAPLGTSCGGLYDKEGDERGGRTAVRILEYINSIELNNEGQKKLVKEILMHQDQEGFTPLLSAAFCDKLEPVERIIQLGERLKVATDLLQQTNNRGNNSLNFAASSKSVSKEVLRFLFEKVIALGITNLVIGENSNNKGFLDNLSTMSSISSISSKDSNITSEQDLLLRVITGIADLEQLKAKSEVLSKALGNSCRNDKNIFIVNGLLDMIKRSFRDEREGFEFALELVMKRDNFGFPPIISLCRRHSEVGQPILQTIVSFFEGSYLEQELIFQLVTGSSYNSGQGEYGFNTLNACYADRQSEYLYCSNTGMAEQIFDLISSLTEEHLNSKNITKNELVRNLALGKAFDGNQWVKITANYSPARNIDMIANRDEGQNRGMPKNRDLVMKDFFHNLERCGLDDNFLSQLKDDFRVERDKNRFDGIVANYKKDKIEGRSVKLSNNIKNISSTNEVEKEEEGKFDAENFKQRIFQEGNIGLLIGGITPEQTKEVLSFCTLEEAKKIGNQLFGLKKDPQFPKKEKLVRARIGGLSSTTTLNSGRSGSDVVDFPPTKEADQKELQGNLPDWGDFPKKKEKKSSPSDTMQKSNQKEQLDKKQTIAIKGQHQPSISVDTKTNDDPKVEVKQDIKKSLVEANNGKDGMISGLIEAADKFTTDIYGLGGYDDQKTLGENMDKKPSPSIEPKKAKKADQSGKSKEGCNVM